jgi:hypothetical protein
MISMAAWIGEEAAISMGSFMKLMRLALGDDVPLMVKVMNFSVLVQIAS